MSQRPRRPTATDDDQKTEVFDRGDLRPPEAGVELPSPTHLDPPPLQAISMKTPGELAARQQQPARQHQVHLRPIDVRPDPPSSANLGRLAPPRDPREVRARRMRDYVIWTCAVVVLASVVMLSVWFIARR
ncbi:MAG: hypothetical protein KIT31_39090 [Deltaproteobacteria bacterium]|nr:hypothetical protein [Deltaproteobacteria bacterium]